MASKAILPPRKIPYGGPMSSERVAAEALRELAEATAPPQACWELTTARIADTADVPWPAGSLAVRSFASPSARSWTEEYAARAKLRTFRADVVAPAGRVESHATEWGPGGTGRFRPGRTDIRLAASTWRPHDAPLVQDLRWLALPRPAPILVLTFSHEMNRKRVQDLRNYTLRGPDGRRIDLDAAVYGLAPRALLLFPRQNLQEDRSYRLRINARGRRGVRNVFGVPLDGRGTGLPGADFAGIFSARNRLKLNRGDDAPVNPGGVPGGSRPAYGGNPPTARPSPLDLPEPSAVDEFLVAFEQALRGGAVGVPGEGPTSEAGR